MKVPPHLDSAAMSFQEFSSRIRASHAPFADVMRWYYDALQNQNSLSSEGKIMHKALTKIKDSKLTPTKHWVYSIDLAIQALAPVSEGLTDD